MKRIALLALVAIAGSATANVTLYGAGRQIKDQSITVKSWGSGAIAETDETALVGTHSVRVTTRNYFQGGLLEFGRPVDLAASFNDKNNLLMFSLRMADGMATTGGAGMGMPGGGRPGGAALGGAGGGIPGGPPPGAGGPPAGMGAPPNMGAGRGGGRQGAPGGMPGGMMPGGMGGGLAGAPPLLRQMRVVVTTTDGLRSEAYIPLATLTSGAPGWRTIGLPLQGITGFERTNKIVKSIALSGDTTGTFFVGELKVLNDSTPLFAEPNVREMNLALGDEVELFATGQGGASLMEYTWDFDSSDGIQVDAIGQTVRRRFRKAGDYTITLTVRDLFGLKAPYSTTLKATVNP